MNETSDVLIACTIGDLSWLKRSLNVETNSNFIADTVRNSEGLGPLHLAAKNCKLNVLEYLLTHCTVEVDSQAQPSGDTALHCALSKAAGKTVIPDVTRCVKMLLNKGANCNRQNSTGSSPVHYAAAGGHASVLNTFLSHGANIHLEDGSGKTAYDLACLHGHYKCARLLQALIWADKKDSIKVEEHYHSLQLRTAKGSKHPQRPVERLTTKLEPSSANELEHQIHKNTSTANSKVSESRKLLHVSKTKISLQQMDRNVSQVGKPDRMYPYTNYPPAHLRQHNSATHQSTSDRPPAVRVRMVQSARTNRTTRPCSGKSLRSQSLSSTHYSHGRRMPHCTKATFGDDIYSHSEFPSSAIDAKHSSPSHAIKHKMSMNIINLENVDLSPGDGTQFSNESPSESGSEDSDNGGSSTSVDGLMFHDVGQVNDLKSLSIPSPSTSGPAISPTELLQVLRLASSSDTSRRQLRRASSFTPHRGVRDRSECGRRFSLGAIPEGQIVTHYHDEQPEKQLEFDAEFLYSIMPFAFQGLEDTPGYSEQSHTTPTSTCLSHHNSLTATTTPIPTSPTVAQLSKSEPVMQGRAPGQLSVVTVAWETKSKDVADDRPVSPRTGQPRLPLSPTGLEPTYDSPPPSPSHTTQSKTCKQYFQYTTNEGCDNSSSQSHTSHPPRSRPHLLHRRVKSAPQKRVPQPQSHRQVLKSTLFEFGGGLKTLTSQP